MPVNHGGALTKEFFLSYLRLLLTTRAGSIKEAEDLTIDIFFKGNLEMYGLETKLAFEQAMQEATKQDLK
ncbi:hypothetical protein SAMN05428946_2744 [Edaphobacillus lindanitolerans]|uniref:Uncharacterized protein n=2 Tax=Edaphobacillus lindanitolerans TaxID=550447 RepID=A0A1U7PR60_9BACI|nr:hypothetical protein [Edaphobacillus lindanitolerans]SIT91830.1 hypothetical protein SAMN05428946_2744 [Edaphobacillus lindanitolerans]